MPEFKIPVRLVADKEFKVKAPNPELAKRYLSQQLRENNELLAVMAFSMASGKVIDIGEPVDVTKSIAASSAVMALIHERARVRAIKLYRTENGCSLLEAKHAVDEIIAGHYKDGY